MKRKSEGVMYAYAFEVVCGVLEEQKREGSRLYCGV